MMPRLNEQVTIPKLDGPWPTRGMVYTHDHQHGRTFVQCAAGHRNQVNARINADGTVVGVLRCRAVGCSWQVHAKLGGWDAGERR